MTRHRISSRGFTLIELLVVIAIIGLLSSVVLASLGQARSKARDAKRTVDIRQLQTALELYYDSYGRYPSSVNCGTTLPSSSWCNSVEALSDGHWIRGGSVSSLAPYIPSEPTDPSQGSTPNWTPLNGGTYYYYSSADQNKWYMIVYGLENYPSPLENQDGVRRCDGYLYHYGTGSNGILTVGSSCPFQ